MIRDVRPDDTGAILAIYEPYILDTAISFETETPRIEEFRHRIVKSQSMFPWLVFESEGEICGFAYASPHRSRCAYGWSVDVSAYVSPGFHRRGIGGALYESLFAILRRQNVVNAFAGIAKPNQASEALHTSKGFRPIGVYKNVGYKLGRWWDVGWWQLELSTLEEPRSIVRYEDLLLD